jgi:YVTN family beta-propeller protein
MIDAASNTQGGTVPTPAGVNTEALAVTPDGRRAYVAGFEFDSMSVLVVDTDPSSLTFNSVVATISNPFGSDIGAFALAITPDGSRAYVPGNDFVNNKIWVIDTDPSSSTFNSVIVVMNVGGPGAPFPRGVAITPDGSRAYVAFAANSDTGNFVRVIDTATNSVVADIDVSRNPVWVAITPHGRFAYVAHQQGPNSSVITRIDTLSNTVVGTIPISVPTGNLQGLAMTPDGTRAYVTNAPDPGRFIPGSVQVIDIPSNSVVATIPIAGAGGGRGCHQAVTRGLVRRQKPLKKILVEFRPHPEAADGGSHAGKGRTSG